jgi:glycopeptide antibiotics resistance protein
MPSLAWVQSELRMVGEFAGRNDGNGPPPIIATWFELPDASRCVVDPEELAVNTEIDMTWRSMRWINDAPDATAFAIRIFPRSNNGTYEFLDVRNSVVTLSTFYLVSGSLLVAASLALILAGLPAWYRNANPTAVTLIVLLAILLLGLMVVSANNIETALSPPLALLGIQLNPAHITWYFSIGHLVGFSVLAFCLTLARKPLAMTTTRILLVTTLFAFATESLQFHLPGRNSTWEDLLFDVAGSLIGLVVAMLISRMLFRNSKASQSNTATPANGTWPPAEQESLNRSPKS